MSYKHFSRTIFIAFILVISVLPEEISGQSVLFSPEIIQPVEDSRASEAFWSVIVRDSSGTILDGYNVNKLVRPASNLKLLTTAAILDALGENYRYRTYMYGMGYQEGNVWKGDIIIRGMGDPSINGKFYNGNKFYVFEKFYAALDSAGITRIDGNLIGNDSYFDQHPYPKGWSWDDLSFYYGVEINALSFNENAVDLQVLSDKEVGEIPGIQWFPFDTDYVEFINEQVITPPQSGYDEFYQRILGTNTILLRSKVPQNYYEEESLSIMNASLFFMDTFRKYLETGGIHLSGRIIIDSQSHDWESDAYKVFRVHRSPPLRELLKEVNKESNNFYTEMLLKTAAAEHFDTRGSTELGLRLVKDFAQAMGMDTTRIKMTDGAGMAPSTLLTMEDLSNLLVQMQHHESFTAYRNSLAVAGVDGSLKYRFRNSRLRKNLAGKTGYVSGVRALSGYMKASSGKPLIFSVAANNYAARTSYIDRIQESILQQIYDKY